MPTLDRIKVVSATESKYLASRGLEVPPGIKFARDLDYFGEDGNRVATFAAMLGDIQRGDAHVGWHATYLQAGAKAPVSPNRKIINVQGTCSGGSVQLYPAEEVMGVGEGIETCIAATMISGIPTWSALNTALLKNWEPPAVARKIFIFADNDANYAGQAAAYALAHRLKGKGLEVVIELPGIVDSDWNDALLEMRSAA